MSIFECFFNRFDWFSRLFQKMLLFGGKKMFFKIKSTNTLCDHWRTNLRAAATTPNGIPTPNIIRGIILIIVQAE